MKKIESFTVNHDLLKPGIYVSRVDSVGRNKITTFDIRCKKPNVDEPMTIESMHTLEHLAATYFRNIDEWKGKVIYFGPMGCQTGFYLVLAGDYPLYRTKHMDVIDRIVGMFRFVAGFDGTVPGTSRIECGNHKSHDLKGAKLIAANMLVLHDDLCLLEYEYPTGDVETDNAAYKRWEKFISRRQDERNRRDALKRGIKPELKRNGSVEDIRKSSADRYERDDISCLNPKPEITAELRGNSDFESELLKIGLEAHRKVIEIYDNLDKELANEYKKRKPSLPPEWEEYFKQKKVVVRVK